LFAWRWFRSSVTGTCLGDENPSDPLAVSEGVEDVGLHLLATTAGVDH
jgi:hypothetical protein